MTDITSPQYSAGRQQSSAATHAKAAKHERQADGAFLRRILFGLIAATVVTGAVTIGLTTQQEFLERMQYASTHGPA